MKHSEEGFTYSHKRRISKVHMKLIILGLIILALLLISFLAPYFLPNDPYETNMQLAKLKPCREFPFGTDGYGRCVYSRVLIGARTSICSPLILVVSTLLFGIIVGVLSGYYLGVVDILFMRFADILMAFPGIVLAIAVAGIMGGGLFQAMLALAITSWTQYARIARGLVMGLKEELFIQAAKLAGNSDVNIMVRHLIPNIIRPLVVTATLQVSTMMIGLAGLSFLGLGVQIPQAEWGSMISEGKSLLQIAPWVSLAPGCVMLGLIIIFNLFGDCVSDFLDTKKE